MNTIIGHEPQGTAIAPFNPETLIAKEVVSGLSVGWE